MIFDTYGQRFFIVNESDVEELNGEGGLGGLHRTEVSIEINNLHSIKFVMSGKAPNLLYLNGKPALKGVLYFTFQADDMYWYGFYFKELDYRVEEMLDVEIAVRTVRGMGAKCLRV